MSLGIRTPVLKLLDNEQWGEARAVAEDMALEQNRWGYQADGLRVVAGPSWLEGAHEER